VLSVSVDDESSVVVAEALATVVKVATAEALGGGIPLASSMASKVPFERRELIRSKIDSTWSELSPLTVQFKVEFVKPLLDRWR